MTISVTALKTLLYSSLLLLSFELLVLLFLAFKEFSKKQLW